MGLADQVAMRQQSVETGLLERNLPLVKEVTEKVAQQAKTVLVAQGLPEGALSTVCKAHLKYEGTDTALPVSFGSVSAMTQEFEAAYSRRFHFLIRGRDINFEALLS